MMIWASIRTEVAVLVRLVVVDSPQFELKCAETPLTREGALWYNIGVVREREKEKLR